MFALPPFDILYRRLPNIGWSVEFSDEHELVYATPIFKERRDAVADAEDWLSAWHRVEEAYASGERIT
jgi:hypothetical protein